MKKNITLALAFLGLFLSSCSKSADKNTLVYGLAAEPKDLDPAIYTDVPSKNVIINVCEGLAGYEGETDTKIVPKLASSWDISSDRKTYTFHLREGVKFHDGTEFNADAVLFSLLRQHDKNNPYYKVSSYWIGMGFAENVESIEKKDDKTVAIKLKHPDGTFLAKMAIPSTDIVSPTAYKKLGDEFNRSPVCSGPFVFKQWNKGQTVYLARNDNYWDKEKLPKIEKVIFKVVVDASSRFLGLKKGELDIAEQINPQNVKDIEESKDLQLLLKPISGQDYLWFNVEQKPFDNVKVRQALAHLVDKQGIVNNVLLGYGKIAKNPIPTTMWGYNESIVDYDLNVEKAKQLLAEAGYPNGFEMDLVYNKENVNRKAIAEIIQGSFAKAGVKVSIKNSEWGTFLNDVKYRKYNGAALLGWGASYLDPNDFLTMNFSKRAAVIPANNISGWYNNEFDKYNEDALLINNQDSRAALYKKSQEIIHNELPVVTLFDKAYIFGARKNVKNFVYLPLMTPYLNYVVKD